MIAPHPVVAALAALALISFSGRLAAHDPELLWFPVLTCQDTDGQVRCLSRWSPGFPLQQARIDVVDRGGRTLVAGKSDGDGGFRFERPEGAWAVVLSVVDSGGQSVEWRWTDAGGPLQQTPGP